MEARMARPLRVCLWTTTFQADVLSLTRYLCADERFEPLVVLQDRDAFLREPVQELLPLSCPLLEREASNTLPAVRRFDPQVTVVDNHFPPKRLSACLFVLWHGFGWKGPNDIKEFAQVHRSIRKLTRGPSTEPNERFIWQCFGPTDLEHRCGVSGFARENLRSLGAAFTDELVRASVDRATALRFYPRSFADRRIALLAFTWHYGRVFSHWGEDMDLLGRMLDHLADQGCVAILRLHDRKRYDPAYLRSLEELARKREGLLLKYKDRDRDSLPDLLVSDLMVSNYSSILNYFYATGRPSIHVYPVGSSSEAFLWRTWKRGKVRVRKVPSADYVWKLPPEENGGIMVKSFEELLDALGRSLDDPSCCSERSRLFIEKHMEPADGRRCEAIAAALLELAARGGQ